MTNYVFMSFCSPLSLARPGDNNHSTVVAVQSSLMSLVEHTRGKGEGGASRVIIKSHN